MDTGQNIDLTPFRVAIPQRAIDELHWHLAHTRWPEGDAPPDWSAGVPLRRMKALAEYWRRNYDWRRFETCINALPQFRTDIDGLGIHFFHVRSKHDSAMPIVFTHGWPGSFVEFLDIVAPLTDPTAFGGRAEDAFHVVIPSLPGFAFSDKPKEPGWNVQRVAKAWGELMRRLGYTRWVAQGGGDWGAGVTTTLGALKPEGLAGIHLNLQLVFPEKVPTEGLSPEEQSARDAVEKFANDGAGYFIQQAARPQTLGYGLADSPVGQAAWIYEKLQAWSDKTGKVDELFGLDRILDNISLYWLTDSAASSARIFWENKGPGFSGAKVDLPVAVTVFPHELYRAPKSWAQQNYSNLIYWNEATEGGHFAAFERPELFVAEMRSAFKALRS